MARSAQDLLASSPRRPDAAARQQQPGAWHEYALKEDWYGEFESVRDFGPVSGTVEGTLPADLAGGRFIRNGPANFDRGGQRYKHFMDGDGMILDVRFPPDGSDEFQARGRFVCTESFQEEESQDRVCARSSFGTQRQGMYSVQNVMDTHIKNVANTHVVCWGGKMLALCETGLPHRLDMDDISTLGLETFGGEVRQGAAATLGFGPLDSVLGFGDAVTAHPHIDQRQMRLIIWSSRRNPLDGVVEFAVTEWDEQWRARARVSFGMEAGVAPHDCAFTSSFYIFAENRMELPQEGLVRYLLGQAGPAEGIQADPDAPSRIHLVARNGAGDETGAPRHLVVETPPWFSIHHSHAEEEVSEDGSTRLVTLYSAGWTREGLALNGGRFLAAWVGRAPDFDAIPPVHYWRTRIEVTDSGARLLEHAVFPGMEAVHMEHPHVLPGEEGGVGATYAYMVYSNGDGHSSPPVGWARLDLKSGRLSAWQTPRRGGCFANEPVVVPKAAGRGAWMLGVMDDHRRGASCLCVLDGDDMERGPVCRMWLPVRLPYGLHGSFLPAGSPGD